MSETPNIVTALRNLIDDQLVDMYVGLPARVVSYDKDTQSVCVKPLIKKARINDDNERILESLPVLQNVPVAFPGVRGNSFTWPIQKGDTVWLQFGSSSLDVWLSSGGEVDPVSDHQNHLDDAVAFAGIRDFNNPLSGSAVSDVAMVFDCDEIRVGGSDADDPVLKVSEFNAFVEGYNLHIHGSAAPGNPTTAPSTLSGTASGSSKLKVSN